MLENEEPYSPEDDVNDDLGMKPPAKQKLTEWKNEPKLADLKADLEEAQSDHQEHEKDVEKWLKNYNGEKTFKTADGRSEVVPKLIRKQAEWRYAALSEPFLSSDDIFEVEPITHEDKAAAYQNALVLNNQFNTKINKIHFIDEYVRTAVDEGTVVVKVGWEFEEGEAREVYYEYTYEIDQNPQGMQMQMQLGQMEPAQFKQLPPQIQEAHKRSVRSGIPMRPIKGEKRARDITRVIKNQPTLEVCEYDRIIIDPTCKGDLSRASFIIHSFETNLSELRKDGRYTNLESINASNVLETDDEEYEDSTFKFKDEPRKQVTVYEYHGFYDIDKTGIVKPIIAAWIGDTMIRMEENPFPDKQLPFVMAQYLPDRKKVYGKPDGYLLEENQKIVGAVTRGMIDMMGRSAAGQQGVRKDALDTVNSRRFERGEDYQFNANVDPRQAFHMGAFPEIPRSAMEMITMQNMEAESLTGVKNFAQGISGQALGSTATAVRGALDAASKRELGILRRLAKGITEIGRKIIAMNSEFLEDEEVVRVTNEQFIDVKRDDLQGNFDLRLKISTAEGDNEKAQELAFMLQTIGPNSDPGEVRMIRAEIAKLRKMPELAHKIENYKPEPDPLAVKKAELEVALLEAQVFNERAQAEENSVDVELKSAKADTERAKTRNLESKSDQQDLDFVEQKDGIKHGRDIDKQENKLQGDLDLKTIDAFINAADEDELPSAASNLSN